MITTEIKNKIALAIRERSAMYPSAAKYATKLGINKSILSRIMNGETERVLDNARWVSIARILDVAIGNQASWMRAETPVYVYVTEQLKACQSNSISGLLCDRADIGKSFAAKCYVKEHPNSVYIDCSQVKCKTKLIRAIAKEFGVDFRGRYADVYADLVFYLKGISNPLIVLDEAGDLEYSAFLELKGLWNATEYTCGWYMMGANALKHKIDTMIERKKVGYEEIFSRYGQRYQRITPESAQDYKEFALAQVALVASANGSKLPPTKMYAATNGSLRRVHTEITKQNAEA
ncbi:ATP-binding protein [uncultured Parabacteroides sp.]|uniref:ATP-binding protein n=1 Tax=uncultured Parabacteroides sp. TaxID=512312 RepID=UPI0025962CBE|nr:ATP-binding protein [uncultured Parabacteroides sp.]